VLVIVLVIAIVALRIVVPHIHQSVRRRRRRPIYIAYVVDIGADASTANAVVAAISCTAVDASTVVVVAVDVPDVMFAYVDARIFVFWLPCYL
jgi:hypothetical protein